MAFWSTIQGKFMPQISTLDEDLLAKYLAKNIDDFQGPLTVTKFAEMFTIIDTEHSSISRDILLCSVSICAQTYAVASYEFQLSHAQESTLLCTYKIDQSHLTLFCIVFV